MTREQIMQNVQSALRMLITERKIEPININLEGIMTQIQSFNADAILALQHEQKPTDYDIVNASIDYSDEFGHSRKSVIELQEAYKAGARDFRDNNIYISPK